MARVNDLINKLAQQTQREEDFDPEGDGYDYKTAKKLGYKPGDDGHWPSRDSETGMQLKGRKHSTWDKAIETDKELGYNLEKRDGRYYTTKP